MPVLCGSKLIACDLLEINVTAGPAVCVHCTLLTAPVQPASTAPAALPATMLASATTEKVPLPVHVGVGATAGGTEQVQVQGCSNRHRHRTPPAQAQTPPQASAESKQRIRSYFDQLEVTNHNSEDASAVNAAHALIPAGHAKTGYQARQTVHPPTATTTASNTVATAYQMFVNRCSRRSMRTSSISRLSS